MITTIIVMLIVGLIAGALARLLVPGRDPIGIGMTIVIGLIGSFVGGFLGYVLFHHDASSRRPPAVRPDRLGHRRDHRRCLSTARPLAVAPPASVIPLPESGCRPPLPLLRAGAVARP